jgi:hypothetical protein
MLILESDALCQQPSMGVPHVAGIVTLIDTTFEG